MQISCLADEARTLEATAGGRHEPGCPASILYVISASSCNEGNTTNTTAWCKHYVGLLICLPRAKAEEAVIIYIQFYATWLLSFKEALPLPTLVTVAHTGKVAAHFCPSCLHLLSAGTLHPKYTAFHRTRPALVIANMHNNRVRCPQMLPLFFFWDIEFYNASNWFGKTAFSGIRSTYTGCKYLLRTDKSALFHKGKGRSFILQVHFDTKKMEEVCDLAGNLSLSLSLSLGLCVCVCVEDNANIV